MITACWVYALQQFPFHTEVMEVGVYTLTRSAANVAASSGCRRWSEMTKQEAAAMLVQLYADYSILCDKYAWSPSDGMSEAVTIAVQSLKEVE